MVQEKNHVSLGVSPGKHGRQIREKYFRAGKPCPVLISCGHDPLLFLAGGNELRFGLCEYDYAGGHRGEPYEIVLSELYGLPIPAHAEIVLEGEMVENVKAREGPFGEFTGYYASSPSQQPLRSRDRYRVRSPRLERTARPVARSGKLNQFPRHHRCLPAVRAACRLSDGRPRQPRAATEGQGKVCRPPRHHRMCLNSD